MANTKEGAILHAARYYGMTVPEYLKKTETENYCNKCKTWKLREKFCKDNSRRTGLHKNCNDCRWTNGGVGGNFIKGKPSPFKGKKHTEETKKLLSEINKKRTPPMLGKKHREESKAKMSATKLITYPRGEKSHLWKGGLTSQNLESRKSREYKIWVRSVFKRDKFTCQECGDKRGGNLNAHHIKSFAEYPEFRTELSNGITLCEKCHKKKHSKTMWIGQ